MYRDDRNFSSATGNDFKSQFNPEVWLNSDENNQSEVSDDQYVDMKRRFSNTNVYKNKPAKIRYNDYMTYGCNEDLSKNTDYSLDSIINKINIGNYNVSRTFHQKNEMDFETKVVNPNNNCNDKRENENNYKAVPYKNGSSLKDSNVDNYLLYGTGQIREKKSRGYPNWFEHQYNYISEDIQDPDHVVFDRGMPTRSFNKNVATKYSERDVM
jgi:hypothetical protein